MNAAERRNLLGAFIRAHRERLSPPRNAGRRRTPGLRREELADAAGLSVTWVTWLEQGRSVTASSGALVRLAGALHLSAAERASLFDLAGRTDPDAVSEQADDLPPPLAALPSLMTVPAYLLDHAWTVRAWNLQAAELFTGWLDADEVDHNLLRYVFLDDAARRLIADWEHRAQRLVAEFRADFHRQPGDITMKALVADLRRDSALFDGYWHRQDVLYREGGERRFMHPARGALTYMQTTLLVAAQREIKLVCLAPQ
ncbi:helix-turn-helix transcriptional regulator [Deinococcus hopiensis]|uniref:Helix-turn-helix domain-containing protein n=1 Tax=Deinococcus hopiensis KR-140 TaxID=695939 RepID=A0A1W1VUA0_9DEIO|nr:helix-turn-helix transcriptional regulator [Deinococcus hopiensis]SMB96938.1 Helix-turn-helix domain-containing protein [Deinococcus hopiensis KR-140]